MNDDKIVKLPNNVIGFINQQMSTIRHQFASAIGLSHGNSRSIYKIYGYPDQNELSFEKFYQISSRNGTANFLTRKVPKLCWRDGFNFYESSEDDAKKILEKELKKILKLKVVNALEKADILNRIGKFSVVYIGIPGQDPETPIEKVSKANIDNIYFKAFAFDGIEICKQVTDTENIRYGLPEIYQVRRVMRDGEQKDSISTAFKIHYSRIIHICEDSLDSEVEGMEYLRPVYNAILDLDKTRGGSSEAYFRNARGKYAFEIGDEYSKAFIKDPTLKTEFSESVQKFTNNWQDHITATGAKVNSLSTEHHSPKDTIMAAYWEISNYSGFPIRVLIGEGSGQLAGSEDQLAVNALIADRQRTICVSWVEDLFDRLSFIGLINLPEDYEIRFPIQTAVTEKQAAEIASKQADAIQKLANAASTFGGGEINIQRTLQNMGIEVEIDEMDDDELKALFGKTGSLEDSNDPEFEESKPKEDEKPN